MSLRSRAREIVLQILYQDDLNKDRSTEEDLPFIKNRLHNNGNIVDFALELVNGVRSNLDAIDSKLARVTQNWKVGRMAATDRNVLRLGTFEIFFYETPDKVAVNEAIELAKRYGNELSPSFVNGVLDRLIKVAASDDPEESLPETPVESDSTTTGDVQATSEMSDENDKMEAQGLSDWRGRREKS